MQKYYCKGEVETLEELNHKTCVIKKFGKKYIRVDNAVGKSIPGDWSYREYFSMFHTAAEYARELANIADIGLYIYLNLETLVFSVVPKTLGEDDKDYDISFYITTIYPDGEEV